MLVATQINKDEEPIKRNVILEECIALNKIKHYRSRYTLIINEAMNNKIIKNVGGTSDIYSKFRIQNSVILKGPA